MYVCVFALHKSTSSSQLTNKLVATLLEASNYVSNQSPLDAVGFDCQECALLVGSRNTIDGKSLARGNSRGQRKAGRGVGKRRRANESRQSSTIAAGSRDGGTGGGGLRLKRSDDMEKQVFGRKGKRSEGNTRHPPTHDKKWSGRQPWPRHLAGDAGDLDANRVKILKPLPPRKTGETVLPWNNPPRSNARPWQKIYTFNAFRFLCSR